MKALLLCVPRVERDRGWGCREVEGLHKGVGHARPLSHLLLVVDVLRSIELNAIDRPPGSFEVEELVLGVVKGLLVIGNSS